MSETQKVEEIAFRPKRPFYVPWADLGTWVAGLVGAWVLMLGIMVLLHRGPGPLAPLAQSRGIDVIALGFLIGVGPIGYLTWMRRRRLLKLDERLPDFLTDLAGLHKAGLTLPESLLTAAKGDYDLLTPEVRMAADQVRWNIPVLTALENLQKRIGTPIAERTLTVVLEAGRTGGNLPEVMDIAAQNARGFIQMRDQRARSMGMYTIIIYVASLVFVGVALSLQGIFVPRMIEAFGATSGAGLGLSSTMPTQDQFRGLFYSAALMQAVGNGLVGGIMTEGKPLAGLRHAWFIVLLTALGFATT